MGHQPTRSISKDVLQVSEGSLNRELGATVVSHLTCRPTLRELGEVTRMEHWWITARLRLSSILQTSRVAVCNCAGETAN
jgi:hypothetical protein